MEFREFAWAQQLYRQRLIYGPAAEATENSYPKYPAAALRELIRQSQHPHNLEPLLLTLARPANADTRKRFAEVAGELVLVERVLSDDVICEDLQVVMGNRVEKAPDGMLYPDKSSQVPFEVWVRIEMLDVLATMLREGVVRSLTPVMQSKLVNDLLQRALDGGRAPLLRAYALRAAHAAVAAFNAVRPDVLRAAGGGEGPGAGAAAGAYLRAAVAALRLALGEQEGAGGEAGGGGERGGAPEGAGANACAVDPFERLKLLSTACQALYLSAAGTDAPAAAFAAEGRRLGNAQKLPSVAAIAAAGAGPLLARAVGAAAGALAEQRGGAAGGEGAEVVDEEKAAAGELSFEDNWAQYLKAGYAGPLVGAEAPVVVAFGGALLQLLARAGGGEAEPAWPSEGALAKLLAAPEGEAGAARDVAAALEGGYGDDATAVVGLPSFAALALAAFGRRCDNCAAREQPGSALKRCSACARAFYCSEQCQKAAWAGGHKAVCKQMQLSAAGVKSA